MRLYLFLFLAAMSASPVLAQDGNPDAVPPDWRPAPGVLPEPTIVKKLIHASDGVVSDRDDRADGPYVRFGDIATGSGWLAVGPGYHHQLLDGGVVVDASAVVSWRLYRAAQARVEVPRLAHDRVSIGGQVMYQDLLQMNYFGVGDQSRESDRTAYRYNNLDVLGLASVRPLRWLSVGGRVGWIPRPDLSTASGRRLTAPSTVDRFSEDSAPGVSSETSFVHGDISIAADRRDHKGHPTRGGLYRADAAGYSDRSAGRHSFQRVELEASQYMPLFTRQLVLALRGWGVLSRASNGQTVPFYLMPSLGGQNTLRGYSDYRFHDNNMQVFNAEVRWSLLTHLDAAAFADAGKVAPRIRDLDFKNMRTSYGFGFRVHNAASTLARLDVGHSGEGWRVFLKLNASLKRSESAFTGPSVVPFIP